MQYYGECSVVASADLASVADVMCSSLLNSTVCVVSSWRRSARAWRVCCTASSSPRGSRCRPRDVMLVVTAVPRLAEDMQDQADQPLVDSEDKVGAHISRYSVPGLE